MAQNSFSVSFSVLVIRIPVTDLIRSRASKHFVQNWRMFLVTVVRILASEQCFSLLFGGNNGFQVSLIFKLKS